MEYLLWYENPNHNNTNITNDCHNNCRKPSWTQQIYWLQATTIYTDREQIKKLGDDAKKFSRCDVYYSDYQTLSMMSRSTTKYSL